MPREQRVAEADPISANATVLMRKWRDGLGWSAEYLSDICIEYGASLEPPVESTLSRTRIAKLENGTAVSHKLTEVLLLSGVFGVELDDLITNSPSEIEPSPDVRYLRPGPGRPREVAELRGRVDDLEQQMAGIIRVLGELGVTELS